MWVRAHAWIFFTGPVPAQTAGRLRTGLLRKAMALRGQMDLAGARCRETGTAGSTSGRGDGLGAIPAPRPGRTQPGDAVVGGH
jgi:hypothetical protein